MSTYNSPSDVAAATLARSSSINNVDAATAAAFALLPTNANINAGKITYGTDTGAADAYAVALPQTALSYTDGLHVAFKPVYSCTGASTINVDGLGVKTIKLSSGAAVEAGHIIAGTPVEMRYSTTTGFFHLAGTPGAQGVQGPEGPLAGTATSTVDLLTGAAIASAATIDLTTATGNLVHVTGTTTITAVTLAAGPRTVIFDDVLTLTHHATNNNLPSAANITTAAGDRAVYWSDGTTVYCLSYQRASGAAVTPRTVLILDERTSNTILGAADGGKFIDVTSGTFSQTFDPAATLGANWMCFYRNSGTGDITLEPDGAELIDGLANFIMYPNEVRLIQCDGSALRSVVLRPFTKTFTGNGTFTKPPGYSYFDGLIWGGGGSGARNATANRATAGGGGGCTPFHLATSALAATETVTIGAAVAGVLVDGNGTAGNNSTLGALATGYGGGRGLSGSNSSATGGGGGGALGAGPSGGASSVAGGEPSTAAGLANPGFGGGGSLTGGAGASAFYGGGGGGTATSASNGGASVWGGGGGGGGQTGTGGASTYGGAGGAAGNAGDGAAGTAPGGGGGSTATGTTSGAGARGELRIWGI